MVTLSGAIYDLTGRFEYSFILGGKLIITTHWIGLHMCMHGYWLKSCIILSNDGLKVAVILFLYDVAFSTALVISLLSVAGVFFILAYTQK